LGVVCLDDPPAPAVGMGVAASVLGSHVGSGGGASVSAVDDVAGDERVVGSCGLSASPTGGLFGEYLDAYCGLCPAAVGEGVEFAA
jgi:hypothetical protein